MTTNINKNDDKVIIITLKFEFAMIYIYIYLSEMRFLDHLDNMDSRINSKILDFKNHYLQI